MLGFRRLAALEKYVPFRYLPGLFGAVAVVLAVAVGALEGLEYWSLEKFFEVRGAARTRAPIVIVAIDESSFIELNQQWPFPRAMHADLLRKIAADRPLAIGIDLIFDVPSARGEDDDVALGEAVTAAGNVVLGAAPKYENRGFVEQFDANMPLPIIRSVLINFNGPPRTFPWILYYRAIKGEDEFVPKGFFRDKIVLIGPTSDVLHDFFPTAFARGAEQMPGVEIHANVLETYIRGNRIREVPAWIATVMAAGAALVGAALVIRLHA